MIDEIRDQVIDHLEDMHALEQHVGHQLERLAETTEDMEFKFRFLGHRRETERHEQVLAERLRAYGRKPSLVKDAGAILTALNKGIIDRVRHPTPATNARDAYVAEHLEIAGYSMLEHLAVHAGDWATAEAAREIRAEEEAMAGAIAARWEKVVHLSLPREGARA